jgi:hypothetical protein
VSLRYPAGETVAVSRYVAMRPDEGWNRRMIAFALGFVLSSIASKMDVTTFPIRSLRSTYTCVADCIAALFSRRTLRYPGSASAVCVENT